MEYDQEAITEKIKIALDESNKFNGNLAYDIAFHMTDWLEDMSELNKFYIYPESYNSKQVTDLLMKFLLHAPNHLAAAHKLFTKEPISDVFGVGALE